MLGEKDKVVGVPSAVKEDEIYFPELSKLPSVGSSAYPDLEVMASLNPDCVLTPTYRVPQISEKFPSITVVGFYFYRPVNFVDELTKVGYIFDKTDKAKHYIDDFHDKHIDFIKARTEGLSEEERPKVYVEAWSKDYSTYCAKSAAQKSIDICGGRNIFADIPKGGVQIDPEAVVERNPDIIIKRIGTADAGYEYDVGDTSKIEALWESIMNRPELANVEAVKSRRVYIIDTGLSYGLDYPIAHVYMAKWFHPELFEDFDPKAIHQEYLTEFYGLDYDLDEHGVFVYPPLE